MSKIILLVVFCFSIFAAHAQQEHHQKGNNQNILAFAEALNLSENQQKEIELNRENIRNAIIETKSLDLGMEERRVRLHQIRKNYWMAIQNILTAEQQTQWAKMSRANKSALRSHLAYRKKHAVAKKIRRDFDKTLNPKEKETIAMAREKAKALKKSLLMSIENSEETKRDIQKETIKKEIKSLRKLLKPILIKHQENIQSCLKEIEIYHRGKEEKYLKEQKGKKRERGEKEKALRFLLLPV